MERGADKLRSEKEGRDCCREGAKKKLESEINYEQSKTGTLGPMDAVAFKQGHESYMRFISGFINGIEFMLKGEPRYSVEELDELISKILAAELDSDLEPILYVSDTVELDKFWNGIGPNNDDSFKDLLKNSKKVKELLEQPVKPSKGLAGLFD